MSQHTNPSEPVLSEVEPAGIAEAARAVIVALVALGWITLDQAGVNAVVSAVGVLASIGLTIWTRRRVTPVAKANKADLG